MSPSERRCRCTSLIDIRSCPSLRLVTALIGTMKSQVLAISSSLPSSTGPHLKQASKGRLTLCWNILLHSSAKRLLSLLLPVDLNLCRFLRGPNLQPSKSATRHTLNSFQEQPSMRSDQEEKPFSRRDRAEQAAKNGEPLHQLPAATTDGAYSSTRVSRRFH